MVSKSTITRRKRVKTLNVMSRYTREKKCPYCDTLCKLEFEPKDPLCAIREVRVCEHLVDYDKYYFDFARDGFEWDD
jgi:hypothetical protein